MQPRGATPFRPAPVFPSKKSPENKNPCMKQGFRQSHSFENGKANFPIFSAQLTVASPETSIK